MRVLLVTRVWIAWLGCLAWPAADANAQSVGVLTGTLEGRVTDVRGRPLAGAAITIVSRRHGVRRRVLSDARGGFRAAALPPGIYGAEATHEGFSTAAAERLELLLGETLRLDIELEEGAATSLSVSAQPLIDVASPTTRHALDAETLALLPKRRRVSDRLDLFPGVRRDAQAGLPGRSEGTVSIHGASTAESLVFVDGMDVSSTIDGSNGLGRPFELAWFVSLQTSPFPPQQSALGGTIHLLSPSGSRRWRGGLNLQYGDDHLTSAAPTPLRLAGSAEAPFDPEEDRQREIDGGSWLGGSAGNDRLRFFGGWVRERREVERPGADGTFNRRVDVELSSVKGNWRPRWDRQLTLSHARESGDERGVLPEAHPGPPPPIEPFLAPSGSRDGLAQSLHLDWIVHRRLELQAFGGRYRQSARDPLSPTSEASRGGARILFGTGNLELGLPSVLSRGAGFSDQPPSSGDLRRDEERRNLSLASTASFYGRGSHTLRAGLQRSELSSAREGTSDDLFTLLWDQSFAAQRGELGVYSQLVSRRSAFAEGDSWAAFLEERWRTGNRFTLSFGLRAERERVRAAGQVLRFGFGDKLAPRLGFAYDVGRNGRWKLYGRLGWFHDALKHHLPLVGFGGAEETLRLFRLDSPEWPRLDGSDPGILQDGGDEPFLVLPLSGGQPALLDPNLRSERSSEATLGTVAQLLPNLTVGVSLTHRGLHDSVVLLHLDPDGGPAADAVVNPAEGLATQPYGSELPDHPGLERSYFGLELTALARFGRWSATASYHFSRLAGNYDGLADADDLGRPLSPNHPTACRFLESCFTADGEPQRGRLALDRPHELKLHGVYRFPSGFSAGGFLRLMSGTPFEREIDLLSESESGDARLIRLFKPEGRGSGPRHPFFTQLDLHLQYDWQLPGGGTKLALSADVLNVLDTSTVLNRWSQAYLTPIPVSRQDVFTAFDPDQHAADAGVAPDPRLGRALRRQAPREVRLGLAWRW